MRFGAGTLLDLLEARFGAANPVARFVDLSRIPRSRAWQFFRFGARELRWFHTFRLLDRERAVMPEAVERIKHGFGLERAHTAATHRVVKHPVAFLPQSNVLVVGNIMQNGRVAIFSFERSAHERPKRSWDRRAVHFRSGRGDPHNRLR